jgi:aldehyde:ferredoxin oxidoreductase
MRGATPDAEPRFLNAVTGKEIGFTDGMEMGRKICNLDRAIFTLQGRHRDMEVFTGYVFKQPVTRPYPFPVYEDGQWQNSDNLGRKIDKDRFEEWKTHYYELEGWDTESGFPKRDTLEEMGLKEVADELERKGRLGK